MITQVIMVRVGILNEELAWNKLGEFSANGSSYTLLQGVSLINPEYINYLLEITIEETIVRRARIGLLTTSTRGLSFEFVRTNPDAVLDWFLNMKYQYMNNGDDWFQMAMALGEMYYTNDLTSLAALSFESSQRRALLNIHPNFEITFNKLENIIQDDVELDDIWTRWEDDISDD